jgi:hypothetical protein
MDSTARHEYPNLPRPNLLQVANNYQAYVWHDVAS